MNQLALDNKKATYSYDELIKCGKGDLYGIENGKLPMPPLLMFDRITHIADEGGIVNRGLIKAEFDINPDLWFFQSHFVNDPVMPGCLGLDALWQLVGFFLVWRGHEGKGRALGCGDVKFTGQILPTSKVVSYEINIKRIISKDLILVIGDGQVFCDGEQIYTAKNLKVGLFKD